MTNITTSPETLEAIWKALNGTINPRHRCDASSYWSMVAGNGWLDDIQMDDLLYALDPRLEKFGLKGGAITALLDLPWRIVARRSTSRFDQRFPQASLPAEDLAATLIFLERLGFHTDPSPLCALLRPALLSCSHLTEEEAAVLVYDKSQHRSAPITISTERPGWRGMNLAKVTFSSGYKAE